MVNHFIPYLTTRHRMCTKAICYFIHSISSEVVGYCITGGISTIPPNVPYTERTRANFQEGLQIHILVTPLT